MSRNVLINYARAQTNPRLDVTNSTLSVSYVVGSYTVRRSQNQTDFSQIGRQTRGTFVTLTQDASTSPLTWVQTTYVDQQSAALFGQAEIPTTGTESIDTAYATLKQKIADQEQLNLAGGDLVFLTPSIT